jgi:hypothetical protein
MANIRSSSKNSTRSFFQTSPIEIERTNTELAVMTSFNHDNSLDKVSREEDNVEQQQQQEQQLSDENDGINQNSFASSTSNLLDIPILNTKKRFSSIGIVILLFSINLLNYCDRFTIASMYLFIFCFLVVCIIIVCNILAILLTTAQLN